MSKSDFYLGLSDLIAGAASGAAGVLAGHPLDTLRVRLQTSNFSAYKMVHILLTKEGITSFFRGMSAPLAMCSIMNSTLFFAYGQARSFQNNVCTPLSFYVAGTYAGIVQTFVECPIEHVKIRLQLLKERSNYRGPIECSRFLYRHNGIRSIYKGFNITMLRNASSYGVYFASYELVKLKLQMNKDSSTPFEMFVAGGVGGVLSWAVIYPLDVVKTRIQSDCLIKPKYIGIKDCIFKSYREEGLKAFFKGLNTTLARTFVVSGVNFLVYEFISSVLIKLI